MGNPTFQSLHLASLESLAAQMLLYRPFWPWMAFTHEPMWPQTAAISRPNRLANHQGLRRQVICDCWCPRRSRSIKEITFHLCTIMRWCIAQLTFMGVSSPPRWWLPSGLAWFESGLWSASLSVLLFAIWPPATFPKLKHGLSALACA